MDKLDEASLSPVYFYQIYSLLVFDHLSFTNAWGGGGCSAIPQVHYCGALYSAGVKMLTIVWLHDWFC